MHSDTHFAPELSFTTPNQKEAVEFLVTHEAEERPIFTESIEHHYNAESKEFQIKAENQELRFTRPAYYEFCAQLGIPNRFAERIPNELLLQCVDEMLSDNNLKVRLIVRDKNIVSGCKRDSYIPVNPREFMEAGQMLFDNHLFREASISDHGTSFLFEPLTEQIITPSTQNVDDKFNVGIAFGLGYQTGLVEAHPYSLRHCCINVAITPSETPKYNLVEKVKRKSGARYYDRLLENYTSDRYKTYMAELNNRIAKVINRRMTDHEYVRAFTPLNRMLGKEVSFALIGIDEDRHKEIMAEVAFKKAKDNWDKNVKELEDLDVFEVFNSITAAAKGYNGLDRVRMQSIGGSLL